MPFIHVNSQRKWLTFMSYLSSCYIRLHTGVCVLYVPFSLRHLETHSSGPVSLGRATRSSLRWAFTSPDLKDHHGDAFL